MRIQHARVRLAISTDISGVSVTAPPRYVKDYTCLNICPAASPRTIVRGVRGEGIHMVSVLFADMVKAKARRTSTITSIILAIPCGDRESMQASSTSSMPHTARRTKSRVGSGPIDVEGSFRCTSSARMAGSSLNLWRTTFSTAARKMFNNSGNNTHPCRSPCSTSNQSDQTPPLGRTQALISSRKFRVTAIINTGSPMRVSTCHKRVRSTVSYAFWRSMKHIKRDTPALRPIFCNLRTTNIVSMVERSGRKPHCFSG